MYSRQSALLGLMGQTMIEGGSEGLKHWWKEQSRKVRQNLPLQVSTVEHLIAYDNHQTGQPIVIDGLKRHYDERLVLLIRRLAAGEPDPLKKYCASCLNNKEIARC